MIFVAKLSSNEIVNAIYKLIIAIARLIKVICRNSNIFAYDLNTLQ